MNIILPNDHILRGDLVPLVIKRTDLAVIPSTLEFLVRVDEDLQPFIAEGKLISLAEKDVQYRILSTVRQADGIHHQGNPRFVLIKVIAVLACCHKLAFQAEKAVIKENSSLAAVYRACGAEITVSRDIKISKFTCMVGNPPSFSLQQALQREAAVPVWNGKTGIAFTRVRDLFEQKPREVLQRDNTQATDSEFLERSDIPAYSSNSADGSLLHSQAKTGRKADFALFANAQELNNLSTYLLQRKVWTTRIMANLNAGDIIEIEKTPYVIITATHVFSQSGSGSGSQMSRFWLGQMNTAMQGADQ